MEISGWGIVAHALGRIFQAVPAMAVTGHVKRNRNGRQRAVAAMAWNLQ
jgi:hypothetical protein